MHKNEIVYNKNFFVFTGGPGVGKTAVLDELESRNFRCVREAARQIIKEQPKEISDDPVWRKSLDFSQLMLYRSVENFLSENESNVTTFFDRGIIDSFTHSLINKSAAKQYRYNNMVFIFPPWEEIYKTDDERIQSYDESVRVYNEVINIYKEYDYELLEVPKSDLKERAEFIIENTGKLI